MIFCFFFFFSSRRRHTRFDCDWSSDVCSSDLPLSGGPQMVEVSRDGRRGYFTNSLYGAWDDQFYPDGVGAWMAKLEADPDGGVSLDRRFFPPHGGFPGPPGAPDPLQGGRAPAEP